MPMHSLLHSETRQSGRPLTPGTVGRGVRLEAQALDAAYDTFAGFLNPPLPPYLPPPHQPLPKRLPHQPSYVPPVHRERLAAVRPALPPAPNAGLFFGSLTKPPTLLPLSAEVDARPLGQQSVERHEQRLHARLHMLSERQLARLNASLPPRQQRTLHEHLEATQLALPAIERPMRTSQSTPALPDASASKPAGARLPALSPAPTGRFALPPTHVSPDHGNKKAVGFTMAQRQARGPAGALRPPPEPEPEPEPEMVRLLVKAVDMPGGGCEILLEIEISEHLPEGEPAPMTPVPNTALKPKVAQKPKVASSAKMARVLPPPQPQPPQPPTPGCVARLSATTVELPSGGCHVRLDIAVSEGPHASPSSAKLPKRRSLGRSPSRDRKAGLSPETPGGRRAWGASSHALPMAVGADGEHFWRPPPVEFDGLAAKQVVVALRESLCRCPSRALEHFTVFDVGNTGHVSRADFHSCVRSHDRP